MELYLCHYKSSLSCATPKIELSPGETVMISAGTPHVFTAIRNKQARGLVVAAPSAFARLVATVRTQERANPLDIELFIGKKSSRIDLSNLSIFDEKEFCSLYVGAHARSRQEELDLCG
jgi:hypothetical protein